MGKIFCLMGKSSSGKDTIYKKIMEQNELGLHPIIPCTTRPIRKGETPGVEYLFYKEEELAQLEAANRIIELRSYQTVHGVWKYFTADDGQIDLSSNNYLMIGTLESFLKLQTYFGETAIVPIYIYVDDGLRLQRALDRERAEEEPKYAELCRRFLADEKDFSKENLNAAGITQFFQNQELQETIGEIITFIRNFS